MRSLRNEVFYALLVCASLAGCATPVTTGGIASVREAQAKLVPGVSNKADVLAALGKAITVSFDSGYEVWVYKERGVGGLFARSPYESPELVLLFAPDGVLKKMRTRTAS